MFIVSETFICKKVAVVAVVVGGGGGCVDVVVGCVDVSVFGCVDDDVVVVFGCVDDVDAVGGGVGGVIIGVGVVLLGGYWTF
jgi:hypothetical protein